MRYTFKSGQAATYILSDAGGGSLRKLSGFVTGTANTQYFLHIFDATAVPANASVPLRSEQVLGVDGFAFSYEDSELSFGTGICFGLSSTEETYTAVVDGAKVDWEGDYDTVDPIKPSSYSTIGDIATARPHLQVWTTDNTKKLYKLVLTNNNGVAVWFWVIARAASTAGALILARIGGLVGVPDSTTIIANFGDDGITPFEQDSAGVQYSSCRVIGSLVNSNTVLNPIVTNDFRIKAYYK